MDKLDYAKKYLGLGLLVFPLQENTKNQLNANDIVKLKDLLEQQAQLMKALKENKKELCEQTTKRKSYKFI